MCRKYTDILLKMKQRFTKAKQKADITDINSTGAFEPAPVEDYFVENIITEDNLLEDKKIRYGNYSDIAFDTQAFKDVLRRSSNWEGLPVYTQEALEMIMHKVARILNGDPYFVDNYRDIAGYAKLVQDILEECDYSSDVITTFIYNGGKTNVEKRRKSNS